MRLLTLLIATLIGCGPIAVEDLPTVWVVEELPVRLRWEPLEGERDIRVQRAVKLCHEMNEWLFDMFDGQVYIAKFVIYAPNNISMRERGVCNIYLAEDKCSTCNPHAPGLGTPYRPYHFFTPLTRTDNFEAITMAHEFLHAWVGVDDEYQLIDGTTTQCPEVFLFDGPCIMSHYNVVRMHLCRADTHNEHTEQGQRFSMSCYELAQKNLKESSVGNITIPDGYIRGPKDVPKAEIVFKLD